MIGVRTERFVVGAILPDDRFAELEGTLTRDRGDSCTPATVEYDAEALTVEGEPTVFAGSWTEEQKRIVNYVMEQAL